MVDVYGRVGKPYWDDKPVAEAGGSVRESWASLLGQGTSRSNRRRSFIEGI